MILSIMINTLDTEFSTKKHYNQKEKKYWITSFSCLFPFVNVSVKTLQFLLTSLKFYSLESHYFLSHKFFLSQKCILVHCLAVLQPSHICCILREQMTQFVWFYISFVAKPSLKLRQQNAICWNYSLDLFLGIKLNQTTDRKIWYKNCLNMLNEFKFHEVSWNSFSNRCCFSFIPKIYDLSCTDSIREAMGRSNPWTNKQKI